MSANDDIRRLLVGIYGEQRGRDAAGRVVSIVERFAAAGPRQTATLFSEKDEVLITYADSLQTPGEAPLATLHRFVSKRFEEVFSTIHLLPFYPWSSDDGFSVVDFHAVEPALGGWPDVHRLRERFSLMFDFVLNHLSSKSPWFEKFLNETPGFEDLAIEIDPGTDVSEVTRPRARPLLTPFQKESGQTVHLWTTFSEDQIDLNYRSLNVLEKMVEVLCFYTRQGATAIRMDAVAYLWKEVGTSCIHLPETHAMVKLFRKILDVVAPETVIVTETNVPHEENIRYFGHGGDEAQLVYNFSLPPLLLHAFCRQDATVLSDWARGLTAPDPDNTFFNFTASHDGIGVRPLEGILPPAEIDFLIDRVNRCGGTVSFKADADGGKSPYELNITYVDAMRNPDDGEDPFHALRFLASQAVAQVLPGVPGVYIHSILGSRNWVQGVSATGRARTINREKLQEVSVAAALADGSSLRARIFFPYREMIKIRRSQPAFHPNADFAIVDLDPRVFAILRTCQRQRLLAVTNVSGRNVAIDPFRSGIRGPWHDLVSGRRISGRADMTLGPYRYAWLSAKEP